MKFKDPLATIYYLGGSVPTHLGMLAYVTYALFWLKPQIVCDEITPGMLNYPFQDLREMFVAHIIYVLITITRALLNPQIQAQTFLDKFLGFCAVCIYFSAYIYMNYRPVKVDMLPEETYACILDEADNQAVWEEINLYRYFEMFIFYA